MSEEIDVFWRIARIKGSVADLEPVMGQLRGGTLPPPAFAFSADPDEADRILAQVLDGSCTQVSTPRAEFAEEADLPQVGDLAIVLDGGAHPRALIRTVAVARAEQEGQSVVTETFRVLYPRRRERVRESAPVG